MWNWKQWETEQKMSDKLFTQPRHFTAVPLHRSTFLETSGHRRCNFFIVRWASSLHVFTIHLTRWKGPSNYVLLVASSITVPVFLFSPACPVQYTQTVTSNWFNSAWQIKCHISHLNPKVRGLHRPPKKQPLQFSTVNYNLNKIEKQHYQFK